MTKSAVIVALVLLAGTGVAAHGQCTGRAVVGPVHPGTALLDSMGIFAGVEMPVGGPVHPGTAILDSMGIYAGARSPTSTVADNACQIHDH